MPKPFVYLFLLLLCIAPPARAAGYTPQSFNGVWRFDVERTRAICGEKAVAGLSAADLAGRFEISIDGQSEGHVLLYYDARHKDEYEKTPVSAAEVVGDSLVLHIDDSAPFPIRILDADSLLVWERGLTAVLVRAPDAGPAIPSGPGTPAAAAYVPESFNGIWRFDPERTRAEIGTEEGIDRAEADLSRRVEMLLPGAASEGYFRVFKDTEGEREDRSIPIYKATIVKGNLLLYTDFEKPLSLRILDADSLVMREGEKSGILIRVSPEPNR